MSLFRRRTPTVLKKATSDGDTLEERKTFRIGGQKVEVRRVEEPGSGGRQKTSRKRSEQKTERKRTSKQRSSGNHDRNKPKSNGRPPLEQEIIIPTDVGRRQMLVRSNGDQTQIVILEGPVLVEHYVARPDRRSMVGNIYLGKTRNVLPGMEASFLDFGAAKNGVLRGRRLLRPKEVSQRTASHRGEPVGG